MRPTTMVWCFNLIVGAMFGLAAFITANAIAPDLLRYTMNVVFATANIIIGIKSMLDDWRR